MKYLSSLFFVLILLVGQVFAQTAAHPGVDLYLAGKNSEAINSLSQAVSQKEYKSNGEIWNYLGLAYIKGNDYKQARKALEKAVKLSSTNSIYHSNLAYVYMLLRQTSKAKSSAKKAIELDPKNVNAYYLRGTTSFWDRNLSDAEKDANQVIALDQKYPQGYVLKSYVIIAKLEKAAAKDFNIKDNIGFLKDAVEVLRTGVDACKDNPNRGLIEDELESISTFYEYFSKDRPVSIDPNAEPEPGVTKLKILSKPRPSYTDKARVSNVQGTIRMAVLFAANGRVQHTLVLNRLGSGLDEQAIIAARKIKFEPMMKDGQPVSVVRMVEYTFSIY